MAVEKYVHGYHVTYDNDAQNGVSYLETHLDLDCAKVFFVYAQHYRTAPFEDQNGHKFFLTYEHNTYLLERK